MNIQVTGPKMKRTVGARWFTTITIWTFTRVNGKTVYALGKVNTVFSTATYTREVGSMIKSKVVAVLRWARVISTKDHGEWARSMGLESIPLLMVIIIRDNLSRVWDLATASINGLMVVFMMEIGRPIRWMAMADIEVRMVY